MHSSGTWGNANSFFAIGDATRKSKVYPQLLGISDKYDEKATIAGATRWLRGTLEYVTSDAMPVDAGKYLVAVKLLSASCTFMAASHTDIDRVQNYDAHKLLKSRSETVLHRIAVEGEKDIFIANKLCDALGKIILLIYCFAL